MIASVKQQIMLTYYAFLKEYILIQAYFQPLKTQYLSQS